MIQSVLRLLRDKKLLLTLLFLIVILVVIVRALLSGQRQPQYQTVRVERGTVTSVVSASGQMLSSNAVNVTTGASGIVKEVFVSDGDEVKKGDKIAEIELDGIGQQKNASAWSSYLSAKNSVDSASATAYTLRSAKDTAWKKFYDLAVGSAYQNSDGTPRGDQRNSSSEFQSFQADWLAAEAKYKNQQNVVVQSQAALNSAWLSYQLSSPIITAPQAGTVGDLTIASGMVIGAMSSDASATSRKIAAVRSEGVPIGSFNISEIDVAKVKPGKKATITLDSLPNKTFTGKLIGVDRTGVVLQGVTNYPVIVRFDVKSLEILPNMGASVSIIVDSKENALIIPSSALQTQAGQNFVRVLRKGRVEQVPVETGVSGDQGIEITSGLSEGEEVIVGTLSTTSVQQGGSSFSPFSGGGFGGPPAGGLRPGGTGGGSRGQQQH
ncbi:MAG: efflux RND transporter periplasmic adaptor subunit [Candidatus Levybacteria bacterium]|nr:efflux RND transporter periplasmic adaptor subunit [Candidatus Levybacteria bacterium]